MTMSLSYACAVLSALSDPEERKKHSDKTVMCSIETVMEVSEKLVRKVEYRNAVNYLLKKLEEK